MHLKPNFWKWKLLEEGYDRFWNYYGIKKALVTLWKIREHEDQIKHLTISNKQLNEKLDIDSLEYKKHVRHIENEMDDMQMKIGNNSGIT